MAKDGHCPRCGAEIPDAGPDDLCPKCLLKLGIGSDVSPATHAASTVSIVSEATSTPGDHVGPYKILDVLGEGGMGIVYLAEQQEPVRRRVALKLIKLGMDTKQVIARFEAERQALALMNHPNVAKVFDAGVTEKGRPFFVMEHVPGIPISDYCDLKRMPLRERLVLFGQACEAIQHAHQKGIIHRDIKPSNVLVASEDGKPQLKVIDFGVAKATSQRLTERTLFTQQGILIGTPEYMSPEQAGTTALDVDTRTDIYSLGVLLYELLVGALPFDPQTLRQVAAVEMLRIIREKDPPRPSTKFNSLGHAASEVARRRTTDVRSLARQLEGELEWITMRALEKDPTRRYASASEFAADIQRHLEDEPVVAGPPSAAYRLKKLIRRHRWQVAASLLILLSLMGGLGASLSLYLSAEKARQEAIHERREARRQSYSANIAAASLSLEAHNVADARRRLERAPEEHRDWEWAYLSSQLDRSVLTVDQGYVSVAWAGYSADAERLISVLRKGTIGVHDAQSGSEISVFQPPETEHSRWVTSVSVTRDHRRIARGWSDQTVDTINVDSGDVIASMGEQKPQHVLASYSPDGTRVVTSFRRQRDLRLWDALTGNEIDSLGRESSPIGPAAFSPDGKTIAASCADNVVRVWDVGTKSVVAELRGQENAVQAIAFSPDGTRLATGSDKGDVRLWDVSSEVLLAVWREHRGKVSSISFNPDGTLIASAAFDNSIKTWAADRGSSIATLVGHERGVASVAFSPDGARIVSGGADGLVKIWETAYFDGTAELDPPRIAPHHTLCFNPSGRRIAMAFLYEGPKVLEIDTGETVVVLRDNRRCPYRGLTAWSLDGRWVAADSCDDDPDQPVVRVWDVSSREEVMILRGHSGSSINSIAFNADATKIAASGVGMITVWDTATAGIITRIKGHDTDAYVTAIEFSPDGQRIVSGGSDRTVRVWDVATAKELVVLDAQASVIDVAFSPDGRSVASADADDMIRLWEPATGESTPLRGHHASVESIAFSPNGKRLASGAIDQTVRIWDVASGEALLALTGHSSAISHVCFAPDGRSIASLARDGIRIWDARPIQEVMAQRRHLQKDAQQPD